MRLPTVFIYTFLMLAGTSAALPIERENLLLSRVADSGSLGGIKPRAYDKAHELYAGVDQPRGRSLTRQRRVLLSSLVASSRDQNRGMTSTVVAHPTREGSVDSGLSSLGTPFISREPSPKRSSSSESSSSLSYPSSSMGSVASRSPSPSRSSPSVDLGLSSLGPPSRNSSPKRSSSSSSTGSVASGSSPTDSSTYIDSGPSSSTLSLPSVNSASSKKNNVLKKEQQKGY